VSEADFQETALRRGEALNVAGRYRQATQVLRPAVDKTPGDPWLHCALAEALLQSGHGRDALLHAEAAQQINPASPRILQMLAESHLDLNHVEEATEATDRIVELAPHSSAGYDLRGRIALRSHRYGEAEFNFREAIRLEPNNWALYNNLGVALRHQKREKDAVAAFELAVKANPRARLARRNLFAAISAYQVAGGFIAAVVILRVLTSQAPRLQIPAMVADATFFGGVVLAAVGAWLWARHRRHTLGPLANRVYDSEWMRERSVKMLRYLFRAVPVFVVVAGVILLGVTQKVGFLPWIIAGGVFVVLWWFAWRPAWKLVAAILSRDRS